MADSRQKEKQPERQSVEKLRKKRAAKRMRRVATVVVVVALVLTYITGLFSVPAALFATALDSVSVFFSGGNGYPVATPVEDFKKAEAIGGSMAVLGIRDLVILSPSAAETLRIQHGYGNPAITANNTRICIYNRAGTQLRVESRTRSLFAQTYERPILLASMSEGGYLAVATKSERYTAQVIVYNAGFEELYTWYSAANTPMILTFSEDNKYLAIACPVARGGELGTEITILHNGEEVTKIYKEGSLALQIEYMASGQIRILYDDCVLLYNRDTGEEIERYVYGGRGILYADSTRGTALAIVFGDDNQSILNHVVVLDEKLEEILNIPVGVAVKDILITRDRIYILTGIRVLKYNLQGELLETVELESFGQGLVYSKKVLVITVKNIIEIF